jgi:ABC-type cobalamin/Fe3+-siderophores transport system ATPase subunit
MNITQFQIGGLFGLQQVTIPISDNKLVIVGVNGIGKSTVLSLFYYLIARRWSKPC